MRRLLAFITSLLVALNFIGVMPASAANDYSIIRVRLDSMGAKTSIAVTVQGDYSVKGNSSIPIEQKQYTVQLKSGTLYLTDGSQSWYMGSSFILQRRSGTLRISNPDYGTVNYLGDMEFRADGSRIRLVNHIHLELYLYGVLPYEMSNSWPLEALKAQAVAARNYAVAEMKTRYSSYYHLVDTQSSQVYAGYNKSYGRCIQAVNETEGQVLTYGGNFVHAFYSSSNGGKTERAGNIFSTDYPYLVVKDDPYDISNPSNSKASWKVTYAKTPVNSSLVNKIVPQIINSLMGRGYRGDESSIAVKSIDDIIVNYNDSGRLQTGTLIVTVEAVRVSDGSKETVQETVSLTKNNARSILNTYSLLFQVEGKGDAFVLNGGGYGHGVGMSQYGAQQMAREGFSYKEILEFYYPGSSSTKLINSPRPDPDYAPPETPEPTPDPTPSPDPEPVGYGVVKVNTSLNVRQGPGTQYKVIGSLTNNTKIEILEQTGDWYKMKAGNLTGYVSKEYVELENAEKPDPDPDPPQDPPKDPPKTDPALPPNEEKYGIVTASALNVRSGPGTKNHKVGMVVKGDKLKILEKVGEWYKISFNSLQGYVHGDYVKIETSVPEPPAASTGTVTASSLNVRSGAGTNYKVIGGLKRNAVVEILGTSGKWYKIKSGSLIGYVHSDYVSVGSQPPAQENPSPSKTGTVTASSLNVRSGAGTNYKVIGGLKRNAVVEILGTSGKWYKIKSGSLTGYVHSGKKEKAQ
jgi:stage II sporulation protein D